MTEPKTNSRPGRLSFGQTIAYSLGAVAASFAPMFVMGWLMRFYYKTADADGNPVTPFMSLTAIAVIMFIGKLSDSVSNPLVGYFSDQTKSRWGRRIPYIIFGPPVLAVTMVLIWFPPTDHPSWANNFWLAGNLVVFWAAYTAIVAPWLSLLPEVALENEERIRVGTYIAGTDILGRIIGAVVVGLVINAFVAKPSLGIAGGLHLGGLYIKDGYKLLALVGAVGVLLTLWPTWWFIKEPPHTPAKEVNLNFFQAVMETMKNPTWPHYLIMVTMLVMTVEGIMALIPFYADNLLHLQQSDSWAGLFQGSIIIGAALFLPLVNWAANRYGKKAVFSLGLLSFAVILPLILLLPKLPLHSQSAKLVASFTVFLLLAPGASAMLVLQRPIITDIMDFDEKITGFRREAMYNGMEGLMTKIGSGLGPVVIAVNFGLFDFARGTIATFTTFAAAMLLAFLAFRPYPIRK
jgi:glycoside/pentoside/hexuronide:cation symporter, GPH family